MNVIKRDGRIVPFDKNKIKLAVSKAFLEIDGEETTYAKEKAREIANYVSSLEKDFNVEEIQDIVVNKLMASSRKDVATHYVEYRYLHKMVRDRYNHLIKAVAEKFTTDGPVDLTLVLPESLKKELEPFVTNELAKILGAGVEASFSKKVSGGFQIGPKDGGYFISLTDATFTELISEYLRPATKKLLFG